MRTLRRLAVLLVTATMFAGCTGDAPVTPPVAAPSPPPVTPSVTPTPDPSPRPPPQPRPFRLELTATRSRPTGNAPLFGRPAGRPTRRSRVAARRAARTLERYLNAMFVDRDTRTTLTPVRKLLTRRARRALQTRDAAALGAGLRRIAGGNTGAARARAAVLHGPDRVFAVTLTYTARIRARYPQAQRTLRQHGSMVFVPTPRGWRADLVDVRLDQFRPRLPDTPTPSATP